MVSPNVFGISEVFVEGQKFGRTQLTAKPVLGKVGDTFILFQADE